MPIRKMTYINLFLKIEKLFAVLSFVYLIKMYFSKDILKLLLIIECVKCVQIHH